MESARPCVRAFSLKNKLAYSVEAEDPGYDAPLPKTGDVVIDGRITLPGIGFSKGEETRARLSVSSHVLPYRGGEEDDFLLSSRRGGDAH